MRVKISDEILLEPKKTTQIINFICNLNGRHSICTDNVDNIFESLGDDISAKELLKEQIIKQCNGINYTNSIEIVLEKQNDQQVLFDDFGELLSQSAVVVLENKLNDTKFLKTILESKNHKNISNSYGKYWRVESVGGCGQIPRLLEEQIGIGIPSNRLAVIHDSDKLYPQDKLNKTHANIINTCNYYRIKFHTLRKREMENYIVDELLFTIFNFDPELRSAWDNLSKSQKSHFDYKYGFNNKSHISPEYNGLFKNISKSHVDTLTYGFGSDIAQKAFTDSNLDYFKSDKVRLWCHNADHEFKHICSIIESIL